MTTLDELRKRLGAATHDLDAWELANGTSVPAMSNKQISTYTELLRAKADAKAACRAEWHGIHRGTDKDNQMPSWMI